MNVNRDITQEEFERIEQYLLGNMSDSEKEVFETELRANKRLRDATADLLEVINAVEVGEFKNDLEEIHQKTIGVKPKSNSFLSWLAIAAGIALLMGVGMWLFDSAPSHEKLFAEYVTKDPGLPVPMTASTDNYLFHDAMVDYKAGKYEAAIEKWDKLKGDFERPKVLSYYLGSAYFNLGNYTDAVSLFAEAQTQPVDEYNYKAQWYTILSLLKTNDLEAILETAVLEGSPYGKRIQEIKHTLEK